MSSSIKLLKSYPSLLIIAVLIALFSSLSPYFFTAGNAESILLANSVVLIAAVGMTLVFFTGGIDLSIATVISATAVIGGLVMAATDSVLLGTCAALSAGLVFGLLNGVCVGFFGLNPFITTMGTALIARGIAFTLSEGIAVKGTPDALLDFGFELIWGIPSIMVVALVVVIISALFMAKTTWGRQVMLFGSNRNAARYCGIKTRLIETSVYIVSGLLAGIAGMISIANLGNALPGVGDTLLLLIIGGVVLGGTHMNGGEGSIMKTVQGVAILAILTSGLNLMGIPFYDQLIVQGALIFIGYSLAMKLSRD
ncbi:ABC transporter permease [Paraglaciecola sp. L3A3]|uniref:ABC transporter permease n=1 Tax=Paraglaciecola sp. L3A3 TaxID=2686358 RepID=UPI00131D778D|nr:ABC transporter permease [Paraglaciecola sp. L3A3]